MVRRSQVIAVLLVVAVLILAVGIFGVGEGGEPTIRKDDAASTSPWSGLGIGALVGALVGAVGTHLLRERAEGQRERREMIGLLRLLLADMRHNQTVLYRIYDDVTAVAEGAAHEAMAHTERFQFAAWEDTRVRLAQLLPSEAFTDLSSHYRDLQRIVDLVQYTNRRLGSQKQQIVPQMVPKYIRSAETSRTRAREVLERYLGSEAHDTTWAKWIGPDATR